MPPENQPDSNFQPQGQTVNQPSSLTQSPQPPTLPTPPVPPVPPTPPPQKFNKKVLLLGLLLLFMSLVIAVSLILFKTQKLRDPAQSQTSSTITQQPTPTPNVTANWQIYTNSKFNYSAKYPGYFIINNYEQVKGEEEIIEFKKIQNGKETSIIIDISDNKISKELYLTYRNDVENRLQNNKPLEGEFDGLSGEYNKISIAGYEAYQLTLMSETQIISNAMFEKDGFIYKFQTTSENLSEIEIFNQILSTFKFLGTPATEQEKVLIDNWIKEKDLNEYGDPKDSIYAGGTPLFNELTGKRVDRYEYILEKHPDRPWNN